MNKFSKQTIEAINYYVYELIDPRNGQIFYIGKGHGNRVFAHANDELKKYKDEPDREEDDISNKIQQIREIRQAGLEVIHIIVRHGLDSNTALEVEAALIDSLSNDLTNRVNGHHSSERGIANVKQIEEKYSIDEYKEPNFEYIIIKIKQDSLDKRGSYYEACRSAWKIKLSKAKKYKYVICSYYGIIKGVYEVEKWQSDSLNNRNGRIEFVGKEANDSIKSIFLDKRLPSKYIVRGMASPVLYSKNK